MTLTLLYCQGRSVTLLHATRLAADVEKYSLLTKEENSTVHVAIASQ